MFGKEGADAPTSQGSLNSILGQGCKVTGDIELTGTLRIDGEFEGKIHGSETLIVGKSGKVKANIDVKNAVIGGKIEGNINAANKIELQTGSHVEGDIVTSRLVIDEGVFFEGNCKMGGNRKVSSAPSTPEKKPETAGAR